MAACLADRGFRKLCASLRPARGDDSADWAEKLWQMADYSAEGKWVRRRGRQRGSKFLEAASILGVLESDALQDAARLTFIEQYCQRPLPADFPHHYVDTRFLEEKVQRVSK